MKDKEMKKQKLTRRIALQVHGGSFTDLKVFEVSKGLFAQLASLNARLEVEKLV
jgi:hypothetical protein